MSAALSAVESGATVTLVSRTIPARSGSACIREGINAGFGCDPESHVSDTMACGCNMADRSMVERMCADAPRIAELLGSMGVIFDRTQGEGRVRMGRTCAASEARAIYSGASLGARVLSSLSSQALRHESHGRINALYGWEFLSLVMDDGGRCCGVVAQDMKNMQMLAFAADAVVICSGGYQSLFQAQCSSELCDGFAAMRACEQGAIMANPEFVEEFPMTIPAGGKNRAVVEAALVEGGELSFDRDGRQWLFMKERFPDERGLVSRWMATRAIIEASATKGVRGALVDLDLTSVDPAIVEARLKPFLDVADGFCDADGLRVGVVPSVGLTLGGLWVDENHATNIEGLFAAGGCACAYHGAGSLAGNEILASVHGGMVAGSRSCAFAEGLARGSEDVASSVLEKSVDAEEDLVARLSAIEGRENVHALDDELKRAMSEAIAGGKENERLARTAGKLTELVDRAGEAQLLDRMEWANGELFFTRTLNARLKLARMVIEASLAREESRGCHFRQAFPEEDDAKWKAATKATWSGDGVTLGHFGEAEY